MSRRSARKKNQRPSVEVCTTNAMQNAASTMLANIRFSSVDEPIQTVCVTSSTPNEGKTTVALALAIAIGRMGHRCLLLEGDMRRRSLRTALNARSRYGIHSLLTGECTLRDAIVPTQFEQVELLDAEQGVPNPCGILNSRHYAELLEKLKKHYRYVIVDTPPVTAFADASIIASKVDGVVLVAREGYTDRRDIQLSSSQLRNAGANVLGVAFNGRRADEGSGYDYYYYYEETTERKTAEEVAQLRARHGKPVV